MTDCIQKKIEQIQKEEVWNPPARIYRYKYKNQKVYFVPQRCCDISSELYDENCYFICTPDGGITGNGDGRYPDFFETRQGEMLVWKDNRK